jgi:molybdopterin-guanine dinucleotide biosynthesis protein A
MKVGGIILCGGRSGRMGRPKAWLPFGGETMLQCVVSVVREVVDPVVVVAAPDQEIPLLPSEVETVRDEEEGRGPLQGLLAGLIALEGKVDAAYLSSCDVPLLQPAFVKRMIGLLGDNAIAVPIVDSYPHPLAAVYRLLVRPKVEELLAANRLRPAFLFDALPTIRVSSDQLLDVDPQFLSLRNLNTPEEYESVLREFAR